MTGWMRGVALLAFGGTLAVAPMAMAQGTAGAAGTTAPAGEKAACECPHCAKGGECGAKHGCAMHKPLPKGTTIKIDNTSRGATVKLEAPAGDKQGAKDIQAHVKSMAEMMARAGKDKGEGCPMHGGGGAPPPPGTGG